ncbi:hypothetical protein [Exilibacterium tricleocarpae]|uniref:hypothetical protein n=1 Tax=Exilibacterium tricleocarpae TaxID=2591008 RepID=UPI001FE4E7F0|nr:hypothetical protein [Exilibacterium tricleocarpae]
MPVPVVLVQCLSLVVPVLVVVVLVVVLLVTPVEPPYPAGLMPVPVWECLSQQ